MQGAEAQKIKRFPVAIFAAHQFYFMTQRCYENT